MRILQKMDWGCVSKDYAAYRSGPPDSFYHKLSNHGIGIKNQKILDLGTGTGILARRFAKQGAIVTAIDISQEQIKQAEQLANKENLTINFKISPAELMPFLDHTFEVITANQCFGFFDKKRVITEIKRLLVKNGLFMASYCIWLPEKNEIVIALEKLILKYNQQWNKFKHKGQISSIPEWAKPDFQVIEMFAYDEPILFTQEEWRGRIRATKGIGTLLTPEELKQFDIEHEQLLKHIAPEQFTIIHRIVAHIMTVKDGVALSTSNAGWN